MPAAVHEERPRPHHGQHHHRDSRGAAGEAARTGKGRGIAVIRDTAAQQPSTALATACATDLPQPATAGLPWQTVPRSRLLPLCKAASDTGRRERPGPPGGLSLAGARPRAARRRSSVSSPTIASPLAIPLSRARSHPQGAQARPSDSERLDGGAAPHNRARSAGRAALLAPTDHRTAPGAPRPTDLPAKAVSVPHDASAPRTPAPAPHNRDAPRTTTPAPSPGAPA